MANPTRVLIAGGGIAALELLLALRAVAGRLVAVTLLTDDPLFAPPAMTVAEPFERGGARTHDWVRITRDQDAELVLDKLVAVDADARMAFTHGGRRLRYDVLAIATGARRIEPFAAAVTFGTRGHASRRLRDLVAGAGDGTRIAFALAFPSTWPLPMYELALLAAHELRERGAGSVVSIVTPERVPLELFGPAARDAVAPLLRARGVNLVAGAQPRELEPGGLRLDGGELLPADHVVAFAEVVARPIAGLPVDRAGFIPVDLHGCVGGETAIFAAGDGTSFPLRQGGLATQQADAVAEAIAASCGAGNDPAPFRPVLRGRMLTSGAPLYLQSRPSGQSVASTRALWSPPGKIAGRYLAPYLATARAARLESLIERLPTDPVTAGGPEDAATLAGWIADAELAAGNPTRAEQALDAARALSGATAGSADDAAADRAGAGAATP